MNAMVVGGYSPQMRGSWAKALRTHLGVEVQHYYCADNDFRGLPQSLPTGVEVVLVIAGSCSHKASDRAKRMAAAAGVRCETVSKDAVRTIEWLRERGYVPPAPVQEEPMPSYTYEPPAQVEVDLETLEVSHVNSLSLRDWLDRTQIAQLLPDLSPGTFYSIAEKVAKRGAVYDWRICQRATKNGGSAPVKRQVMVWSVEEVAEIERIAIERKLINVPQQPAKSRWSGPGFAWPQGPQDTDQPVSDQPVSDRPTSETQWLESLSPRAREHYLDDAPPVGEAADVGLDSLLASLHRCASEVAAAAVRERDEWKAKAASVEAERDALKAQLERIKSALGV